MVKKETAEQKLLKLIETSSGGAAVAAKASQQQVVKKQNVLSVVKFVNQALILGVVVAAVLLASEILGGVNLINQKLSLAVNAGPVKPMVSMSNVIPTFKDLAFYASSVDRRNLFKPVDRADVKKTVESSKENQRIARMTERFRLVGVSWLDQVDTASIMIEDIDKKVTYFLKQGEKMGDVVVKNIYADSAVLGYENEEIMIKYDKSQM